jgi:phenylalanyl-tRNA synthetase alpha chain
MQLPDAQLAVIEAASATDQKTIAQLADETGREPETLTGAAFDLAERGLLNVTERPDETFALTEEGATYSADGLPEIRLYRAAREADADDDPVSMGQVIGASGLDGEAVDIALSNFARKGYGEIDSGALSTSPDADPDADAEAAALDAVAADDANDVTTDTIDRLVQRGLLTRSRATERAVELTDGGVTALMEGIEAADGVGRLTPEMLTSGEWRNADFRAYDVEADADRTNGGRVHVLRETAERVTDVLVGMGFREMDGPHADAEFWINDCLFMPQDHPAHALGPVRALGARRNRRPARRLSRASERSPQGGRRRGRRRVSLAVDRRRRPGHGPAWTYHLVVDALPLGRSRRGVRTARTIFFG